MRPTVHGIYLVFLMFVLLFMAFNTGFNLLYLMGATLVAFLLVNVALLALTPLPGSLHIQGPNLVERGQPFRVTLSSPALGGLANLLRPAITVELRATAKGGSAPQTIAHGTFALGAVAMPTLDLHINERGVFPQIDATVICSYPFGFLQRRRQMPTEYAVVVGPRLVSVPEIQSAAVDGFEEDTVHRFSRRGQGGSIFGVREADDRASLRDIHWRQTARLGRLVMIEREQAPAARAALLIMPQAASNTPARERFEAHLDVAISCLRQTVRGDAAACILGFTPHLERTRFGRDAAFEDEVYRLLAEARPPEKMDLQMALDAAARAIPQQTYVILAAGEATPEVQRFAASLEETGHAVSLCVPAVKQRDSRRRLASEVASSRRRTAPLQEAS